MAAAQSAFESVGELVAKRTSERRAKDEVQLADVADHPAAKKVAAAFAAFGGEEEVCAELENAVTFSVAFELDDREKLLAVYAVAEYGAEHLTLILKPNALPKDIGDLKRMFEELRARESGKALDEALAAARLGE